MGFLQLEHFFLAFFGAMSTTTSPRQGAGRPYKRRVSPVKPDRESTTTCLHFRVATETALELETLGEQEGFTNHGQTLAMLMKEHKVSTDEC